MFHLCVSFYSSSFVVVLSMSPIQAVVLCAVSDSKSSCEGFNCWWSWFFFFTRRQKLPDRNSFYRLSCFILDLKYASFYFFTLTAISLIFSVWGLGLSADIIVSLFNVRNVFIFYFFLCLSLHEAVQSSLSQHRYSPECGHIVTVVL